MRIWCGWDRESNEGFMSELPRRRYWQIHLSTAVLMSFVAGGQLMANVTPRPVDWFGKVVGTSYGWPIPFSWATDMLGDHNGVLIYRYGEYRLIWNWLANIAMFSSIAFIVESITRHREGRTP